MKSLASEPGLTRRRITFFSSVIKDWNVNSPISHLAGGMKYKDGKLTVPSSGRYYIYAQIYYHNNGRVLVRVNNAVITMVTPPIGGGLDELLVTIDCNVFHQPLCRDKQSHYLESGWSYS